MIFRSNLAYSRLNKTSKDEVENVASEQGVIFKSIILLLITIASVFGSIFVIGLFNSVQYYIYAVIAEVVLMLLICFLPNACRVLSIPYAICEGFLIGTVANLLEYALPGLGLYIVGLSGVLTLVIFLVCLILYSVKAIRVTSNFRRGFFIGLIVLTLSVLTIFILSTFVESIANNFGLFLLIDVLYVLFSTIYCVISIDNAFQIINSGVDKKYEWYAGVGILLAIVWLFWDILELVLRLVLSSRRN